MTATERLRALLDERGVEWVDQFGPFPVTAYETNDVVWVAKEYKVGMFSVEARPITPEQAIAATLGSGECEVVKEYVDIGGERMTDYTCCLNQPGWGHNFCPNCGKAVKR